MIPASEAHIIELPATVKALRDDGSGKRMIEVEASSEDVDSEGDVVLQKALLDSAGSFVRSGHLDLDHLSEIGHRIGIRDPSSYIIGRPTEVKSLNKNRTAVIGEIMRSSDGTVNPDLNRYDSFWKSLQSDPPVCWSASIYGFPTKIEDCTKKACSANPDAKRYVIEAIDWRSLALTRKPINTSLKGYAKVVTAKAFIGNMSKDIMAPFGLSGAGTAPIGMPGLDIAASTEAGMSMMMCPMNLDHMWGSYIRHKDQCPFTKSGNSVLGWRDHFIACCGMPCDMADIFAHALMYLILRDRKSRS